MERKWKFATALAAVLLIAPCGALAKDAAPKAAKTGGAAQHLALLGGHPNLNGIWQVINTADYDLRAHDIGDSPAAPEKLGALGAIPPGLSVVEGGVIPYLPAAKAQQEANLKSAPKGDPEAACYLPGIPRATYINHPFQIIQGDKGDILIAYQYAAANRTVYMKKVEVPAIDTWMGTSYGSWDGKTLKVVTLSQNGSTWLDRVGDYVSPNATITERFTLKDADHMMYEATIDDPTVYSKPWKISMPLYRRMEPNAKILDFRCVPQADLLLYGDLKPAK